MRNAIRQHGMVDGGTFSEEEQRLVLRLLGHWRALAGDRPMPRVDDFDPGAVPEMWADSFLVDGTDPADPVLYSVGANHIAALGRNPSGHRVASLDENTLLGRAVSYAPKVMERPVPTTLGGKFVDISGRTVLYRSILMPLAGQCGLVLLGGANSRILVLA